MRKVQKKQIEELLDLLEQAHQEIKGFVERKEFVKAQELLGQCQESAVQVGELIEMEEGELAPTIAKLENYCEVLYEIYEELSSDTMAMAAKIYKRLQKVLIQVENSVKNEIKPRLEVVFLPYKASMWDSLESVWRAADADKNTDAYVIPIPYFDRNPDGSFNEEHYEGGQYPEYVPIIRYDEYDFEQRRPDVIYIHNPYDEYNHVTSIHPYFYSKNLRNFTDKLVYIPYFILREIDPENQSAIDGMKHFCFTPGTIYAHQVIVQSENMRQIYISEYLKAAKEMGFSGEHVDRKSLEKKFLGTGSPKFDKVLHTKKEDQEIPEEWRRTIEKPNGSRKKIVFYNTSVSTLLQHGEKMLCKMESVFEIFKENKDEVALLWRPHPLMRETIQSMRPQLWDGYQKIVERYREERWGIYDDSADLNRAIVLSDAYYGDRSSVVQLCRKSGMPVMIQDVEVLEVHQYIPQFVFSQEYGGRLWFLPGNYKGIFSVDIRTGRAALEAEMIPKDDSLELQYLWGPMQGCNEYYVCPPVNAKCILVLDINEKKQVSIENEDISDCLNGSSKYSAQFIEENDVYLIPACAKGILKVDMQQKKAFSFMDLQEIYTEFFGEEYAYLSTGAFYKYNDEIYIALHEKPYLMKINLHRKKLEFIQVSKTSAGFQTLAGNRELIYIISRDGRVILWNIEEQKIERKQKLMVDNNVLSLFVRSFRYDNYICFVSGDQNICLRIRLDDLMISCDRFEKVWDIQGIGDEPLHFTYFDQKEDVFLVSEKHLVRINLRNRKSEYKNIIYPIAEIEKYFEEESAKYDIYYETSFYRDLQKFLREIR